MSNHGDPWRKFVQTFFLAEQPNGYFVLNDIFRFLKEETVESDDASETAVEGEAAQVPAGPEPVVSTPAVAVAEPTFEAPREPTPPPAAVAAPPHSVPTPPPAADETLIIDVPEATTIVQTPTPAPEPAPTVSIPVAAPQTNGIHTPEPEKSAPTPAAEPSPAPSPAPQPAASLPPPPAPAAAPTPPPTTAAQAPSAPAPAPTPAAPAAPRSWASLAASNPKKWGPTVAQESRGHTETPVTPAPPSGAQAPPAPAPAAAAPRAPQFHAGGPAGQRGEHSALVAAQNVTTAQCFVKVCLPIVSYITEPNLTFLFF